ncbi:MAG: glycosyltransferase [Clostridia bacterium]|nr:glycosyltransferase [Clostridia bacterium]
MKNNVLIVIHSLGCGGAEKSLVSLLKFLPQDKWNIDLLIGDQYGVFLNEIPDYVNIIKDNYAFENFSAPISRRRKRILSLNNLFCTFKWQFFSSSKLKKGVNKGELRWKLWGRYLPKLKGEYDLAVSYMNGYPNYYVIDKVDAKKKILWVHNEFEKMGYDYDFERPFYEQADKIVTISQACVDSILRVYPEFKDKTVVLENISSQTAINAMAEEVIDDEFFEYKALKILSVGRLNNQKGFDIAIKAAKILKEKGLDFLWYILGEGELRADLTNLIDENNLNDNVKLVGIKPNPYPYIKACDIFVQSSRFEGKSIVLDEAKILCKPCVVTNYVTAHNSIENGISGTIVEIDKKSLAEGIATLWMNEDERKKYIDYLNLHPTGNESEIEKYISLFEELLR